MAAVRNESVLLITLTFRIMIADKLTSVPATFEALACFRQHTRICRSKDVPLRDQAEQVVITVRNGDMAYMFFGHYLPGIVDRISLAHGPGFCRHKFF